MATATEEPRLLGPALAAEDAGEIDGAVGEQGPPRGDDDDEEILRFMDSVDGYLLLMDSLSSTLRQSAATKLQVLDHAGLQISESNPHFALSKWSLQEECHSTCNAGEQASTEPNLRHRGSATTPANALIKSICLTQPLIKKMETMKGMRPKQARLLVQTLAVK
ncbi:hypothetical protein HU200_031653 [Digitaria exilis]|uniref:Vacuolar ATPase assembly protein VMA22 n=1 Tax=Digitaria exilis TaxID=1010633 RepID=A0A835BPH0_9POAL|nr:hypothetical protein HU200_031653 [Digitaria exilis]